MERVQALPTTGEGEVPSLAPFPGDAAASSAPGLELLALTARSTPGQEGRDALHSLHLALGALPSTPESATLLLRLLDEGAFNELRADDGSLTRELAVATLLRLGYPWALQVHPDELAWYRNSLFLRKRNKALVLLTILAVAALAAGYFYWFGFPHWSWAKIPPI